MARSPISVSQQPREPQRAARPAGIDRHVADLGGIPRAADERLAADRHAAADPDLAHDVNDVVDVDGRPAPVLGQAAEVRLVGDHERGVELEGGRQPVAQRNVTPAEVRGVTHHPVGTADDACHRHADTGQGLPAAQRRKGWPHEVHEVADDLIDVLVCARAVDALEPMDRAAEPDDRHRQRVDVDLQREDEGLVGPGTDERGRPAGGAGGRAAMLGDQLGARRARR